MSRLDAVLRVRSLLERRALAEHAVAERAVADARRAGELARAARASAQDGPGVVSAAALVGRRAGALALQDGVLRADQRELAAAREAELAGKRRVDAAVARRSVERLAERRAATAAIAATRRADKQLDDLSIDRWWRS